tara:strand:- start:6561 stop:7043 length:483 start_codon:yes stop_codon:yes gene_type:complete
MFERFFELNTISYPELFIRMGLACLFGFVLGYNRSKEGKPLGYRVYIIVCVTTCLLALMSIEMQGFLKDEIKTLDVGKIISGVLTGIGFLGAGAIMKKEDDHIIGTTTGACIWGAGGLGLLLGFGYYPLAIIGFIIIAFTTVFLNDVLGTFVKDKHLDSH